MKHMRSSWCMVSAALLCASGFAHADPVAAALRCERVVFSVALSPGAPADQQLVADLCARGSVENKAIQVLIHGGTYDHNYWDFPFEPETYSYVRSMTAAGYATLNLDRIGSGASSHPTPGIALTLHTGAFTIHQVVERLRSGQLVLPMLGRIFGNRIELVGHSLGSIIASLEASTWNDVDGVLLSGTGHVFGPGNITLNASLYPAAFDPKFASFGLPFDYLTTMPGTRGQDFYYLPNADANVVATDELLKQTVTVGELVDIAPSLPSTLGITAPTLVVVGDFDPIVCLPPSCTASGWAATEQTFFGPQACLETRIVPDTGHVLNLHRSAQAFFAIARDWSDRRVGASTLSSPPQSCP